MSARAIAQQILALPSDRRSAAIANVPQIERPWVHVYVNDYFPRAIEKEARRIVRMQTLLSRQKAMKETPKWMLPELQERVLVLFAALNRLGE